MKATVLSISSISPLDFNFAVSVAHLKEYSEPSEHVLRVRTCLKTQTMVETRDYGFEKIRTGANYALQSLIL